MGMAWATGMAQGGQAGVALDQATSSRGWLSHSAEVTSETEVTSEAAMEAVVMAAGRTARTSCTPRTLATHRACCQCL